MTAADIPTGPGAGFSVLVILAGLILGLLVHSIVDFVDARDDRMRERERRNARTKGPAIGPEPRGRERGHD